MSSFLVWESCLCLPCLPHAPPCPLSCNNNDACERRAHKNGAKNRNDRFRFSFCPAAHAERTTRTPPLVPKTACDGVRGLVCCCHTRRNKKKQVSGGEANTHKKTSEKTKSGGRNARAMKQTKTQKEFGCGTGVEQVQGESRGGRIKCFRLSLSLSPKGDFLVIKTQRPHLTRQVP